MIPHFVKKLKRVLKTWLGTAAALIVFKLLKLSWRLSEDEIPFEIKKVMAEGKPVVLAHFHEDEWALLGFYSHRKLNVLVSLSEDGSIMANFLSFCGFHVARGSSSRRASAGLLELIRAVKENDSKLVSLAVDGPRGPRRISKAGILLLAEHLEAPILCGAGYGSCVKIFGRSWSRAWIPLPFSKIQLSYGPIIFFDELKPLFTEKEKALRLVEERILAAKTLAAQKLKASL